MKNMLLLLTLMLSLNCFAQGGISTGGGNGGQTVYIGNNAYLRDIVENNNCTWKNYTQIVETTPKLFFILNQLHSLNPSFNLRIKEEMKKLGYCFTNKRLPYLQYNNSDDLHIFPNQEFDQVAINDSGIVFVDTNIFDKMDAENKAYLFMHEAAHELFDKNEERVKREPRLREFLMNLFRQLNHLATSQNVDGLNFIIQNAKFTALEDIYTIDHEAFGIIMNNFSDVTLATKVAALKKLNYSRAAVECRQKCAIAFYSKTLKANILAIETERAIKLDEMVKRVNYRTNIENFEYLTKQYTQLNKYINNDADKIQELINAILHVVHSYDLHQYEDALRIAFELFKIETPTTNLAGYIAHNFDFVHGEGSFVTNLIKNPQYLATILLGKSSYKHIKYINSYIYYYFSYIKLHESRPGFIFDKQQNEPLNKYIMSEIKINKIFKDKIIEIIDNELWSLKKWRNSSYLVPIKVSEGDSYDYAINKKFRRKEKKELIKAYEATLELLK
jgi:hypothetical protein